MRECLTVETEVLEVAVGEVVLHDGHERGHLAEEQHSVVGGLQLRQDAVQELELARRAVQILPGKGFRQTQTSRVVVVFITCIITFHLCCTAPIHRPIIWLETVSSGTRTALQRP